MLNNAFYWYSPNGSVVSFLKCYDKNGNEIDEYSTDLDVTGHEFTHGVVGYVSGIEDTEHNKMPGAINEGIADVLGILIEQKVKGLESPDWYMTDLRNIKDPAALTKELCIMKI